MLNKNLKYKDIIILAILTFIGFKIVENVGEIWGAIQKFISICMPFIYAFIIAYILNPIMKQIERRFKVKRALAILITYLLVTSIIALASIYIIPNIIDSIVSLIKEFPSYISTVERWINSLLENQEVKELLSQSGMLEKLTTFTVSLGNIVVTLLQGALGSFVNITTNLVMVFLGYLIAIYILADKEKFIEESKTITYMIFKENWGTKIIRTISTYNKMIGAYIGTKAIDSAIIGGLALIGLYLIGAPYAILLAIIVGVTNMIPYFGPLVGEIIGAFVGLFVSPGMAITIFIFLLALQQFDAWYLDPKLIGDKVGVTPFIIILAVMIGGGLFGPIGMLLGSPTAATLKILYDKRKEKFIEENKVLVDNIE